MTAAREKGRLWAPWRMEYIRRAETSARAVRGRGPAAVRTRRRRAAAGGECLFCRLGSGADDRRELVLVRRPHAFLMLNRFPYNPAHLMVVVERHAATFGSLTDDERRELLELTALAERALEAEYRPQGVNYGANVGRVAGAGYPGHLHLHLVPRWDGDTNFMPVVGETKVLPESLDRTWSRLRRAVRDLDSAGARAVRRRG